MTETSGPRGRISLMRAVSEERLDLLSPGFVHQMFECLDCRACAEVCPSGVRYGEMVETARAAIVAREPGGLPARGVAALIRALFGHLALMRTAARLLRFYQRSGLQRLARTSGILKVLGVAKTEALAPAIPDRFFVPAGQHTNATNARCTVMLHAGCIMQVAFPNVHEATLRVLARNGISTIVPADQGCCGAIATHAGDPVTARALAKRNIAAFEHSGAAYYVVNAAGCGSALKEYGELLRDDGAWSTRAHAFSARVRDVLELLDELGLSAPPPPAAERVVTYQDACHLAHAQRISDAPRRLIARVPGAVLREMPESAVCCGSAGIYNLTQPEMAARLGVRKARNAAATGAPAILTANPGCALQLQMHLRAIGSDARVAHVIEFLDEAYEAAKSPQPDGRDQPARTPARSTRPESSSAR